MTPEPVPLLVMGATGRIGRVLRQCWASDAPQGVQAIWQARLQAPGYIGWDILAEPCPVAAAQGVVLCLAGVVPGSTGQMVQNINLALTACHAAQVQGARHVFLASSAAVYGPASAALRETDAPNPRAAYGIAKYEMEQAVLDWQHPEGPGVTILRIGNIVGLDALLGRERRGAAVWLDVVPGQTDGPIRSYIGPMTLAMVLARLVELAAQGVALPQVLNVAVSPAVSMGALLDAAGLEWGFGPPNPAVLPRVELDTTLLQGLVALPADAGKPDVMVAEWRGLA